jgi:hypothetical protein
MSEVAAFQMFLSLQYFNIMVVTVGPNYGRRYYGCAAANGLLT